MFYHFLFVCIKKSFDFSDIRTEPAIYLKFKVEETVRHDGNSIANPCVCWKMKNLISRASSNPFSVKSNKIFAVSVINSQEDLRKFRLVLLFRSL